MFKIKFNESQKLESFPNVQVKVFLSSLNTSYLYTFY